jgi:uracil-DNA glycosylase
MNNQIEFKQRLFEKLKLYPDPRPFVCDGNPLECNIFIVGINPATEMEVKFEEFWNKEGFNKQKWLEAYKIERVKAPLKNGKKKRLPISPTRRSIEHIVKNINSGKILETNLYIKQTKEERQLNKEDKKTDIFEFLISEIKPQIIVLHGKSAIDFFIKRNNTQISIDNFFEIDIYGFNTYIYPTKHLSRGWSFEKLEELAKKIDYKINHLIK